MYVNRVFLVRAVAVGVICAVAVGACSTSPDPGAASAPGGQSVGTAGDDAAVLTPLEGAGGEDVQLTDGLRVTLPDGVTREEDPSEIEGGQWALFRMPDADSDGLPNLQVVFGPIGSGASAEAEGQELILGLREDVSGYERSSIRWPGAEDAVVTTWTEGVTTVDGLADWECLSLWVDTPDGMTVMAGVCAQRGELEESTALTALRTLRVG